jgi:hypothetical protein
MRRRTFYLFSLGLLDKCIADRRGPGGLAPFILISGTAVFEDCGAACIDTPSAFSTFTFGLSVIASTLGAAAEDPEERSDAGEGVCVD